MFQKCSVKHIDSGLPERFSLNSNWCYYFVQGMYYIDGKYFTNIEFSRYFKTKECQQ